ncbi:ABC transporter ATP-binding protein [Leptolyngbya sp. FACHB-261]|uniref:ABC transporter ATP-binding protein n=1 Tax=Leptolyngbya sp. FACHB-261 TaxID=2692806 RepID=UPI0016864BA0|nr:ABC transporter ATP-binding protein [Leptolyngbya sp. FACHB-261]MBD2100111.1 ABC transporter ATP-binding protein [Leptolyngbya sp. FACHB-261]
MKVLEANNLRKIYRQQGKTVAAVRGVSLSIAAGEVLAFLGPNGAGKTTTIKMIAGLIRPDAGWVRIADRDPHHDSQALSQVGAVLEGNRNTYWRLTPEENLAYFGTLKGLSEPIARRRGLELLDRFDLVGKRHTPVQSLSRGMQQKLALAVALIHQPKLLLLDEPTLGLDVEATQSVKTLVREIAQEGRAILLTTHQLNLAEELSDRVAIINAGEIITEKPTHELVRQFSGSAYVIEVEGDLTLDQSNQLKTLDARIEGRQIIYTGQSDQIYSVLSVLKPLPLVRVAKDQADLTEIFLKLVHGREGA